MQEKNKTPLKKKKSNTINSKSHEKKEAGTGNEPGKDKTVASNQILGISDTTKIIMALLIIAIAIFLIMSFQKVVAEKGLEDKCKEIENHPDLNYDCRCTPLYDTDDNEKDEVEEKTTPMCRCICDVGGGTLWTTDVRVSK